ADATSPGRAALRAGFVAEAEHSDGIASFVLTDDAPLSWDAFARAMETLIALRGPDLLRVKGLLNVAGCRGPVVVHVVQHLAHPPVELAGPARTAPAGSCSSPAAFRKIRCATSWPRCARWRAVRTPRRSTTF